eukprot:s2492_g13.t1
MCLDMKKTSNQLSTQGSEMPKKMPALRCCQAFNSGLLSRFPHNSTIATRWQKGTRKSQSKGGLVHCARRISRANCWLVISNCSSQRSIKINMIKREDSGSHPHDQTSA